VHTRVWTNTQCTIVAMSWNREDSWVEWQQGEIGVLPSKRQSWQWESLVLVYWHVYTALYHLHSKVSVPKPPQPCSWQTMIYIYIYDAW
jgi:hypothetical protein